MFYPLLWQESFECWKADGRFLGRCSDRCLSLTWCPSEIQLAPAAQGLPITPAQEEIGLGDCFA